MTLTRILCCPSELLGLSRYQMLVVCVEFIGLKLTVCAFLPFSPLSFVELMERWMQITVLFCVCYTNSWRLFCVRQADGSSSTIALAALHSPRVPSAKGSFSSLWWLWPPLDPQPVSFWSWKLQLCQKQVFFLLTHVCEHFLSSLLAHSPKHSPFTPRIDSSRTLLRPELLRGGLMCPQGFWFYSLQQVKLSSSSRAYVSLSDSLAAQRTYQRWHGVTLETRSWKQL